MILKNGQVKKGLGGGKQNCDLFSYIFIRTVIERLFISRVLLYMPLSNVMCRCKLLFDVQQPAIPRVSMGRMIHNCF